MLIIGLLILVLAVLFILYVLTGADGSTTIEALNINTTMPVNTLFLSGMAALAGAGIGLWLMVAGARSSAKKRKEHKALERDAREARTHRQQVAGDSLGHDGRDLRTDSMDRRDAGRPAPFADTTRSGDAPRHDESPRYEDHQEERTLRPGEPLTTDPRTGEDPYPQR